MAARIASTTITAASIVRWRPLLRPARWLQILMLGLALIALTPPASAAKLKFGSDEELRHLVDLSIKGQQGEALYLGHKVSFHWFGLSYSVTDDGYVLGMKDGTSFYAIDPAQLARWQTAGHLPNPLPKYELSLFDYLAGHMLWIALALIAAWQAFRYVVPAKAIAVAEPAPRPESKPLIALPPQLQAAISYINTKLADILTILRGTPPPRTKPVQAAIPVAAPAPDVVMQTKAMPANTIRQVEPADVKSMPVARVVCRVKQTKAA